MGNCYQILGQWKYSLSSDPILKTGPYRMAVFTSKDDDTIGQELDDSLHTPTQFGGGVPYLDLTSTVPLSYLRFSYASTAIAQETQTLSCPIPIWDCQFYKCGIVLRDVHGSSTNEFHNVLVANCTIALNAGNVSPYTATLALENVTFDNMTYLAVGQWGSFQANAVNSLLTGVGYPYPSGTINLQNSFKGSATGVYQTAGGGNYYLHDDTYRNQGTTTITPTLLAELRQKTTQAPSLPSGNSFSDGQKFAQAASRDTDSVDLGYHYDPIDWAFANCSAQDATIFVAPGTVIATYATSAASTAPALTLKGGSQLLSVGTPTQAVWIVEYNTVQESPGTWQRTIAGSVVSTIPTHTPLPKINCRFTKWSMLANDDTNFVASAGTGPLGFRDCEFYGGKVGSTAPTLNFVNCLFDRVQFVSTPTDVYYASQFQNSTFHGGSLTLTAPNWTINDNILDKTTLTISGSHNASHNAYVNVSPYGPVPGDSSAIPLTTSPSYTVGPLGSFYLDSANTLLINLTRSTSRAAGDVGLYHYTVKANLDANSNQTKDGPDTSLDIGYHYVALHYVAADSSYNPIDTDADTVPDYLENYSGDGGTSNPLDIASWSGANSYNSYRHVPSGAYPTLTVAYWGNGSSVPAAASGDIILVENGTYHGDDLWLDNAVSGITFRAVTIGGAVIDVQNQTLTHNHKGENFSYYEAMNLVGDGYVIQGFEIKNGWEGGITVSGNHTRILNNNIHDNGSHDNNSPDGQDGIFSANGVTDNSYIGNFVWNNGRLGLLNNNLDHGLYLTGNNEMAANNIILSNASAGIQVYGYPMFPISSMKLYNNTIAWNRYGSAIRLYDYINGVAIANNIIYGDRRDTTCGIKDDGAIGTAATVTVENNLFSYNVADMCLRSGTVIQNNQFSDPLANPVFISETSDWHVRPGSAAINNGTTLSEVTTDFEGRPRPTPGGTQYDIGAYQH